MKIYSKYVDDIAAIEQHLRENRIPYHHTTNAPSGVGYLHVSGRLSPKGIRRLKEFFDSEEIDYLIEEN
jgi:hypothetical protein